MKSSSKSPRAAVSLLLLASIIMSVVSCGASGGEDTPETSPSGASTDETSSAVSGDGLPDKNLGDFELKMLHYAQSSLSWTLTTLDVDSSDTGDRLNDAIYKRNRAIEERFGCKLVIDETNDLGASVIQKYAMSDDEGYDVYFMYDLLTLGAVEYLLDWNEMPYIRLDQKYWNPDATSVFELRGKTYAAAGNFSLSVLSRACGFAFNKDIYEKLNSDIDPYALAADGKWTLDKMYSLASLATSDLDGNTTMDENDLFGLGGSWKETFWRLIQGCGVSTVTKNSAGEPVFTLPSDEKAITKMQKIFDLFTDDKIYFNKLKDNIDSEDPPALDQFRDGKQFMTRMSFKVLDTMRTFDVNVGVLPCPKYDEAQERYYAPSYGGEISVLVKSLPESRRENVGLLLEALSYDSEQNLIPEYTEVLLKTKGTRDNESEAMIDIILDSICFDFGMNAWQDTVARPIITNTYMRRKPEFASTLAKMQTTVDGQIEKLLDQLD